MNSFLLRHELISGMRLSIVAFLPKNMLSSPIFLRSTLCIEESVSERISFIIDCINFLNLSHSAS